MFACTVWLNLVQRILKNKKLSACLKKHWLVPILTLIIDIDNDIKRFVQMQAWFRIYIVKFFSSCKFIEKFIECTFIKTSIYKMI